jgi:hypothetical protein
MLERLRHERRERREPRALERRCGDDPVVVAERSR